MTDRLLKQMIRLHIIDEEEEEIYRFGIEGLLLKLLHYSSYLLIAFLSQEMVHFLLFFVAFLLLRKSAGGYHAKTKLICYICSCLTVFGAIMCMKMFPQRNYVVMICMGMTLIADLIISMLAPLGNLNRRLDEEEARCFRKKTKKVLVIENIFVVAFMCVKSWNYAIPIMIAVVCEGILLMMEKLQREN